MGCCASGTSVEFLTRSPRIAHPDGGDVKTRFTTLSTSLARFSVRILETRMTQRLPTFRDVHESAHVQRPTPRRWVIRLWLPDRPGGLAAVASAIGELAADIVTIDVVARAAETAVDDITIDLGDATKITDVITAISSLSGVAIEDVQQHRGWRLTRAEMLHEAAYLLSSECAQPLGSLCELVVMGLGADWAALTGSEGDLLASAGALPDLIWLRSFAAGMGYTGALSSPSDRAAVEGIVFHRVYNGGLVVGRSHPELSGREADEIGGWAAIAQQVTPDHTSSS